MDIFTSIIYHGPVKNSTTKISALETGQNLPYTVRRSSDKTEQGGKIMARKAPDLHSELRQKICREVRRNAQLTGAVLHTAEGGSVCYNVVYHGGISCAVVTDLTGSGISSPEALCRVLGTADVPEGILSPDPGTTTLGETVTADLSTDQDGNITALTVTAVHPRPVVGISWKKDEIGSDYEKFAEILERNGALAVFLPAITDDEQAREILNRIDGLFVTGGVDIHPKYYAQEPEPHGAVNWDESRDRSDILLVQQAIALDIPLLAVCRGTQVLNVALGGKLIQDVPSCLGAKVLEGKVEESRVSAVLSGTLPGGRAGESCGCQGENHLRVILDHMDHGVFTHYHPLTPGIEGIGIDHGSKWLHQIFGDSIDLIATAHHQAIDPEALGKGLTIAASASDGIVESVEYRDNLFALGLQWHPERDALFNVYEVEVSRELSNAPLRALVKHAILHAARKA